MALEGTKTILGPGAYPKAPYGTFAGRHPPILQPGGIGAFQSSIFMNYGPTVGNVQNFLFSNTGTIIGGVMTLGPGNSAANIVPETAVTVRLPDVIEWMTHPKTAPFNAIQVRDVGGSAAANNITIIGTAGQLIDGLSSVQITQNWGFLRIIPNGDLSGWSLT